ncbi:MAG TPA: tRNA (5-methylaminomethyl-2-thiouridine)(34)-methyltransferase MnmD [Chitinophagaceae bacterium]|nr:tRNA (5-methylaminomethyl-2-thiouridine)(34)-methyltransferase MnmD [Chitinophagaceae bacterium]
MPPRVILTADGSHSIEIPDRGLTYHSLHGALQESRHVFLETGLLHWLASCPSDDPAGTAAAGPVAVFEMGLGTGLNALLTLLEAERLQRPVQYRALELHPLDPDQAAALNYCQLLGRGDLQDTFASLHRGAWERELPLTPWFTLHKTRADLASWEPDQAASLVYFDAFAPGDQPDLWTQEIFRKLYGMMLPGGVLVTYCSKGAVRRALQAAGWQVEKRPGPPGKREIVRALRPA